jgi:hypothetical protein
MCGVRWQNPEGVTTSLWERTLHPYQRVLYEWLPTAEYSPLVPVILSGVATSKDVPNTDVNTLSFPPHLENGSRPLTRTARNSLFAGCP